MDTTPDVTVEPVASPAVPAPIITENVPVSVGARRASSRRVNAPKKMSVAQEYEHKERLRMEQAEKRAKEQRALISQRRKERRVAKGLPAVPIKKTPRKTSRSSDNARRESHPVTGMPVSSSGGIKRRRSSTVKPGPFPHANEHSRKIGGNKTYQTMFNLSSPENVRARLIGERAKFVLSQRERRKDDARLSITARYPFIDRRNAPLALKNNLVVDDPPIDDDEDNDTCTEEKKGTSVAAESAWLIVGNRIGIRSTPRSDDPPPVKNQSKIDKNNENNENNDDMVDDTETETDSEAEDLKPIKKKKPGRPKKSTNTTTTVAKKKTPGRKRKSKTIQAKVTPAKVKTTTTKATKNKQPKDDERFALLTGYDPSTNLYTVHYDTDDKSTQIDLTKYCVREFCEIIWGRVRGYPWWPAQVIRDFDFGIPILYAPADQTFVVFLRTSEEMALTDNNIMDYDKGLKQFNVSRKSLLGEACDIAHEAVEIRRANHYACRLEGKKAQSKHLHKVIVNPLQWLSRRIQVYWPMDNCWYCARVNAYNAEDKKHVLLYDDGAVEWVNLRNEIINLAHDDVTDYSLSLGAEAVKASSLDTTFPDLKPVDTLPKNQLDPDTTIVQDVKDITCWICGGPPVLGKYSKLLSCERCSKHCHERCYRRIQKQEKEEDEAQKSLLKKTQESIEKDISSSSEKNNNTTTSNDKKKTNEKNSSTALVPVKKQELLSSKIRDDIRCFDCLKCEICCDDSEKKRGRLLTCDVCFQCCHMKCLNLKIDPENLVDGFICPRCICCRGCKTSFSGKRALLSSPKKQIISKLDDKQLDDKQLDDKQLDDKQNKDNILLPPPPPKISTRARNSNKKKKPSSALAKNATNGVLDPSSWTFGFTFCAPCGSIYDVKEFCPICAMVWSFPDGNTGMICCDQCDRWVHVECVGLAQSTVKALADDNEEYKCPECLKRNDSVAMHVVLDKLSSKDNTNQFLAPVDDKFAPGYSEIVKTPMDFQTISKKLCRFEYQSVEEFKFDLNLIWRNAKDFNGPSSFVYKAAERLEELARHLLMELQFTIDNVEKKLEKEQQRILEKAENLSSSDDENTSLNKNDRMADDINKQQRKKKKRKKTKEEIPSAPRDLVSSLETTALFVSNAVTSYIDACLICGSSGDISNFLFCTDCGEGYHNYCVGSKVTPDSQRKNHTQWHCPNCILCVACNHGEDCFEDRILLVCDKCDRGCHPQCCDPPLSKIPEGGFCCNLCVCCISCKSKTPYGLNSTITRATTVARWQHNFSLCVPCSITWEQGKYCPVCSAIWSLTPGAPMVCCDTCKKWVHTSCDSKILTDRFVFLINANGTERALWTKTKTGPEPNIVIYVCPCCMKNGDMPRRSLNTDGSLCNNVIVNSTRLDRKKSHHGNNNNSTNKTHINKTLTISISKRMDASMFDLALQLNNYFASSAEDASLWSENRFVWADFVHKYSFSHEKQAQFRRFRRRVLVDRKRRCEISSTLWKELRATATLSAAFLSTEKDMFDVVKKGIETGQLLVPLEIIDLLMFNIPTEHAFVPPVSPHICIIDKHHLSLSPLYPSIKMSPRQSWLWHDFFGRDWFMPRQMCPEDYVMLIQVSEAMNIMNSLQEEINKENDRIAQAIYMKEEEKREQIEIERKEKEQAEIQKKAMMLISEQHLNNSNNNMNVVVDNTTITTKDMKTISDVVTSIVTDVVNSNDIVNNQQQHQNDKDSMVDDDITTTISNNNIILNNNTILGLLPESVQPQQPQQVKQSKQVQEHPQVQVQQVEEQPQEQVQEEPEEFIELVDEALLQRFKEARERVDGYMADLNENQRKMLLEDFSTFRFVLELSRERLEKVFEQFLEGSEMEAKSSSQEENNDNTNINTDESNNNNNMMMMIEKEQHPKQLEIKEVHDSMIDVINNADNNDVTTTVKEQQKVPINDTTTTTTVVVTKENNNNTVNKKQEEKTSTVNETTTTKQQQQQQQSKSTKSKNLEQDLGDYKFPISKPKKLPIAPALYYPIELSFDLNNISNQHIEDIRICGLCNIPCDQTLQPASPGRLLPCDPFSKYSRWVHAKCALWSSEVNEGPDGVLSNVYNAIQRGHQTQCMYCKMRGASIGCWLSKCKNSFHYHCGVRGGSLFQSDGRTYCHTHTSNGNPKLIAVLTYLDRKLTVEKNPSYDINSLQWQGHNLSPYDQNESMESSSNRKKNMWVISAGDIGAKSKLRSKGGRKMDYATSKSTSFGLATGVAIEAKYSVNNDNNNKNDNKDAMIDDISINNNRSGLKRKTSSSEKYKEDNDTSTKNKKPRKMKTNHKNNDDSKNNNDAEGGPVFCPICNITYAKLSILKTHFGHKMDDQEHEVRKDSIIAMFTKEEESVVPESAVAAIAALGESSILSKDGGKDVLTVARSMGISSHNKDIIWLARKLNSSVLTSFSKIQQQIMQSKTPPNNPLDIIFRLGALCIHRLGEIVYRSPRYHSDLYLYPVGFKSSRIFWSYNNPGNRTVYLFEIISSDEYKNLTGNIIHIEDHNNIFFHSKLDKPVFILRILDDPSNILVSYHPELLYRHTIDRFELITKRNKYRPKSLFNETLVYGLNAAHFFGFGHTSVVPLLERLPSATLCFHYRFQFTRNGKSVIKVTNNHHNNIDMGCIRMVPCSPTGWKKQFNPNMFAMPLSKFHGMYESQQLEEKKQAEHDDDDQQLFLQNYCSSMITNSTHEQSTRSIVFPQSTEMLPLAAQYQFMSLSVLRCIRVGYSKIHQWGLFARKKFAANSMVIEYLGEAIRNPVSDLREKHYEATGIGSVYMFRLEASWIIDATKKGNIARFINHSCDPNCFTRVVDINGSNKIIVFASRPIAVNEEITYNYFFASEDERINCKCGALNCSGRLN